MVHKVLACSTPPNKLLQVEATDLYTGIGVIRSAHNCVKKLRRDSEFDELWKKYNHKYIPHSKQTVKSSK